MANKKLVLDTPKGQVFQIKSGDGTVKVKIDWKDGYGPEMTQTFQTVQTAFSIECLRLCDKYTPKDTGTLIASAQISSIPEDGELIWNTPYASAQYHRGAAGSQTGALRGAFWGERMKADNLSHLKAFVKNGVKEGM